MKKSLLFAMALICTHITCMGTPAESGALPGQWTMDFKAAQSAAQEKNLPILINFTGSDWCTWCNHMEKAVFSKDEWRNYAKNSLLMVWIDFPKNQALVPPHYRSRNKKLATLFGIEAYPSYIILDADGKTQLGELEAKKRVTPQSFINSLQGVLIESKVRTQALMASMPPKGAAALKKACDERAKARAELQALQSKEALLTTELISMEKEISELRRAALVANMPAPRAAEYRSATKDLTATQNEMSRWAAANPPQTPENITKYNAIKDKISDLQNKITGLLYATQ